MAMDEELDEVQVSARNRNPNAQTRVRRARDTLAPGSILPRVQALLNPALFRARGDTNALVEDVLDEDGPLGRIAATNPELVTELRQQANTPMSTKQHAQFRSALLGLVSDEVEREGKVRSQVLDNESFMESFAALDGAIPGIRDPKRQTLEESERRQIAILFKNAQALAPLDPEASKAAMVEVRKKADLLTANVRQLMEKNRRDAQLEDRALYANADEQVQEADDIIKSLRDDMDEKGLLREPHPAIVARAFAALGRAGDLPSSGINESAEAVGAQLGGLASKEGDGNMIQTAVQLAGKGLEKLKQGKDVDYLIKRLEFNKALVLEGYKNNRQQLLARFSPLGIELGEKPGEAYAVVHDAYEEQAGKIPSKASTPESEEADRTDSLRTMLDSELSAADELVKKVKPDAAANMPGAAQKLLNAISRQQTAQDDLAIFEDDLRIGAGRDMPPLASGGDAAAAIQVARARRQNRTDAATRSQVRQGIMESLRSRTR
jgi:hypothetical protein